ncbi:MAG: hypothetical protein H8E44_45490 [Planctomycetes bacterium]|nr:hypothetical protein [Planctomycetota bacterium]MBL7044328.1 hypothetical protein [Pirellulaceae bacterium]
MRHASWETTRKHYAPGDIQQEAGVLRDILGKVPKQNGAEEKPADVPRYTEAGDLT